MDLCKYLTFEIIVSFNMQNVDSMKLVRVILTLFHHCQIYQGKARANIIAGYKLAEEVANTVSVTPNSTPSKKVN